MRFITRSRKLTPTVALQKNLRWDLDLNHNNIVFAGLPFCFLPLFLFSKDLKPVGTDQPKTTALYLENKPKNRYNNVLPCELTQLLPSPSPFIASHALSRRFHRRIHLLCRLR